VPEPCLPAPNPVPTRVIQTYFWRKVIQGSSQLTVALTHPRGDAGSHASKEYVLSRQTPTFLPTRNSFPCKDFLTSWSGPPRIPPGYTDAFPIDKFFFLTDDTYDADPSDAYTRGHNSGPPECSATPPHLVDPLRRLLLPAKQFIPAGLRAFLFSIGSPRAFSKPTTVPHAFYLIWSSPPLYRIHPPKRKHPSLLPSPIFLLAALFGRSSRNPSDPRRPFSGKNFVPLVWKRLPVAIS